MDKKIALCTMYVPKEGHKIPEYVLCTNKFKNEYANNYGLEIISCKNLPHEDREATFGKTGLLLYAMMKGYDWAIWMDADAAPVSNNDVKLLLEDMPRNRVLIMPDVNGWNAGVYAVPNNPHIIDWLLQLDSDECHNKFKTSRFLDQDAIADSFKSEAFSDIQPTDEMITAMWDFGWNMYDNIYPAYPTIPNQFIEDRSWCLHIPGYFDEYREWRFESLYNKTRSQACPICGCPMIKGEDVALENYSLTISRCSDCGFIRTGNDFPSLENADVQKMVKADEEAWRNIVKRRFHFSTRILDISPIKDDTLAKQLPSAFHVSPSVPPDSLNGRVFSGVIVRNLIDMVDSPIQTLSEINHILLTSSLVLFGAPAYDKTPLMRATPLDEYFHDSNKHTRRNIFSVDSIKKMALLSGFSYDAENSTPWLHALVKTKEAY